MIFQFFLFYKSAKMSTILFFSINMGCCVYINEENLNDFSKWLQYNKVKNLRGSEYFPYPLYKHVYKKYKINTNNEPKIYLIYI